MFVRLLMCKKWNHSKQGIVCVCLCVCVCVCVSTLCVDLQHGSLDVCLLCVCICLPFACDLLLQHGSMNVHSVAHSICNFIAMCAYVHMLVCS